MTSRHNHTILSSCLGGGNAHTAVFRRLSQENIISAWLIVLKMCYKSNKIETLFWLLVQQILLGTTLTIVWIVHVPCHALCDLETNILISRRDHTILSSCFNGFNAHTAVFFRFLKEGIISSYWLIVLKIDYKSNKVYKALFWSFLQDMEVTSFREMMKVGRPTQFSLPQIRYPVVEGHFAQDCACTE